MKEQKLLFINHNKKLNDTIQKIIKDADLSNINLIIKTGNNFFSILCQNEIDFILINHKKNNFELILNKIFNYIKNKDKLIPVILLINIKDNIDFLNNSFNLGITDFIRKPIDKNELIIKIKHVLRIYDKIETYKNLLIISGSLIDNFEKHLKDISKLKKQLEKENKILLNKISKNIDENTQYLHDLKAPFSSIIGNCQLLLNGYIGNLSEEQKRSINTIEHSSRKLLKMINDFIDTQRYEIKEPELFINTVDVAFLLGISLQDYIIEIKNKGLNIETIYPDEILTIEVDIDKIIRVIQNLLSNAIKNTNSGGLIILKAENLNADFVKISVIDNGCGISKQKQKEIFEKFNQAGRELTGSGLGLAICKNIIEKLHYGKIDIESEEGKGSNFYFILHKKYPSYNPEIIK